MPISQIECHADALYHHFNTAGAVQGDGMTQFGRCLHALNIDILCADTPQATGRIERANKTLQDRLVKELRLQGIATIAAGNELRPSFLAVSWRSARPRPTAAIRCGMSSGLMLGTAS